MDKINILVTGVGGDIGQSIGKILKLQPYFQQIIGIDINLDTPARLFFDSVHLAPNPLESNYLDELEKLVTKLNISLILPTSEAEIRFFATNYLRTVGTATLIIANQESLDIGFDKYRTYTFLKDNSLPYPWTKCAENENPTELPCIYKERSNSGSKNIMIVHNKSDLNNFKSHKGFIWQELLLPDDEEYTCGLYRSANKEIRTVILKRTLLHGYTNKAITVEHDAIEKLLIEIAHKLNLFGSINVQLRMTKNGPIVFEINPRFSSTVMFRHLLGFHDCLWAIQEALGEPIGQLKHIKSEQKLYKFFDEAII